MDPIHFLQRARDLAMWCMMDTAWGADGPVAVSEFAYSRFDLYFMQMSPPSVTHQGHGNPIKLSILAVLIKYESRFSIRL